VGLRSEKGRPDSRLILPVVADGNIPGNGESRENTCFLVRSDDSSGGDFIWRELGDNPILVEDLSSRWFDEAGDDIEKGGFPRSIGTD
jgi:hypothetical protein